MRKRTFKNKQRGGYNHSGKIYIFYHIYCNEKTDEIVKDQCMRIIFSDLYSLVDKIYCFLTGYGDIIEKTEKNLHNFGNKFTIAAKAPGDTSYERFTLLRIHEYIQPEDKFLYIHTKGVKSKTYESDKEWRYENVYWWRTWLEYFLITKHRYCINKLRDFHIVGVNYTDLDIGKHYSGNFWWSTGKYYLTLPNKIGEDYNDPEKYVFINPHVKHYEVGRSEIKNNTGLYDTTLYPKTYIDYKL